MTVATSVPYPLLFVSYLLLAHFLLDIEDSGASGLLYQTEDLFGAHVDHFGNATLIKPAQLLTKEMGCV
jgi:hypothetical protein